VAIVSSESFADVSCAGIVERHMPLVHGESPMHLAESATPSVSSLLQSSINFDSRN